MCSLINFLFDKIKLCMVLYVIMHTHTHMHTETWCTVILLLIKSSTSPLGLTYHLQSIMLPYVEKGGDCGCKLNFLSYCCCSFIPPPDLCDKFQVGDALPDITLYEGSPDNGIKASELYKDKKGIIFAVVGAFSPGCTQVL